MTTPEPVTGATQDPRWTLITEIVSPLLWSPHTDRAALAKEITDAIDAADAAAGIRRVQNGDVPEDLVSRMQQGMTSAVVELLGEGYVPDYYASVASDFVNIAESFMREAQNGDRS